MAMHPIAHAANKPDHPAVIMAGSGKKMTYAEMDEAANRFAQLLRSRGFVPDDAFAVLLENPIEYCTLVWGRKERAHYWCRFQQGGLHPRSLISWRIAGQSS